MDGMGWIDEWMELEDGLNEGTARQDSTVSTLL